MLHPQWAINECLLNGALSNGYRLRKEDIGRELIKGMVEVSVWDEGSRVWISEVDKNNYKLEVHPRLPRTSAGAFVLPKKSRG